MTHNGKLYVVGADFEERYRPVGRKLKKGAKATNKAAHRTATYKLLAVVIKNHQGQLIIQLSLFYY